MEIAIAITGLIGIYLTHVWTKLYEQQKFRALKLNETFKAVNRIIVHQIEHGIVTHSLFKREITLAQWNLLAPEERNKNLVIEHSDMLTDVTTYCPKLTEPLARYQACMGAIPQMHTSNIQSIMAFDRNPDDAAAARDLDKISKEIGKLLEEGHHINAEIKTIMSDLQSYK